MVLQNHAGGGWISKELPRVSFSSSVSKYYQQNEGRPNVNVSFAQAVKTQWVHEKSSPWAQQTIFQVVDQQIRGTHHFVQYLKSACTLKRYSAFARSLLCPHQLLDCESWDGFSVTEDDSLRLAPWAAPGQLISNHVLWTGKAPVSYFDLINNRELEPHRIKWKKRTVNWEAKLCLIVHDFLYLKFQLGL